MSRHRLAFRLIFVTIYLSMVATLSAQNQVTLGFTLEGENLISSQRNSSSDFRLILGLDRNATLGRDGPLDFPFFGRPPGQDDPFGIVVFMPGNFVKDFKPFNPSLTWRLQLKFGDPSQTRATNGDITLGWAGEGGSNLFESVPYAKIELIDGDTVVDMKMTTSHLFSGGTNEVREAQIQLGDPSPQLPFHDADSDPVEGQNWKIDLSEILRIIQLFNNNKFYAIDSGSPDGFAPSESKPVATSGFHDADSDPIEGQNWKIDLSEILRIIQLFNNNRFYAVDSSSHDGFTPSDSSP